MKTAKELIVDLKDRSYPIHIGSGLLNQAGRMLQEMGITQKRRLFVVSDHHVAPLYLERHTLALESEGYVVGKLVVPAGEKSKSLIYLEEIVGAALQAGLDRNGIFLALGGGVIGDLTGFAASTYMRGVDYIQVPTTLLAHDSSVGGKVAVNHPLGKNIIGAFHQPLAVIYDTDTLESLPTREISAGFAEVIKHGLIQDESFVSWLAENSEALFALNKEHIGEALYRACQVKVKVVSQDEKELGIRAFLNLGHTFAHAIESLDGYEGINHGEAVAIGMVGAALMAEQMGLAEGVSEPTVRILKKYKLPVRLPSYFDEQELIQCMRRDKKGKDGELVFVLPMKIGKVLVVSGVEESLVREVLKELKEVE